MKTLGALLLALTIAAPAHAQSSSLEMPFAIRLYGLFAGQSMAAPNTFQAVFGTTRGFFWGGGVEVVHSSGLFVDVEISTFKKDGQRAFVSNGQTYPLGIPLTLTITPINVTGGYRFQIKNSRLTPYAGIGFTSYGYHETSAFADTGDDIDTRKAGFLLLAGAEVRLTNWVRVSADVQSTHVSGILGQGGLSQQLNEDNAGGVAARFRVIVGR